MPQFDEHPLRRELSDEIHARPPVPLRSPEAVSYLAFVHHDDSLALEAAHLHRLAESLGLPAPETDSDHLSLDAGAFRLKWERHNEFSSYAFFRRADTAPTRQHASDHALQAVPGDWWRSIPGHLIAATHIIVYPTAEASPEQITARLTTSGTTTVASYIADGAGWVFTDFQIVDGFSRFIVLDASLTPRQAGRTVQRLLEIETYRVMALLAFPVAKKVGILLNRAERELAGLTETMGQSASPDDERAVLERLTRLAAEVEQSVARSTFRFGAANAYYRLVQQRIAELREQRVSGHPTISEFMERRLTPAISTCTTIARRQEDLSARIARNAQLLRTRVEVELERQNQELLSQMNRRARLQLRLQETVEGLSVVAITYYGSQLVHYLAKGAKDYIAPATPEVVTAIAIPAVAALAFIGLRRTRAHLADEDS